MKFFRPFLFTVAAACGLALSECTRNSPYRVADPGSSEEWSAFAAKVFAAVADDRPGANTVVSPVSIWALTAILAEASEGETAREAEALIGTEKGRNYALPRRYFAVRNAVAEDAGDALSWFDGYFYDPERIEVRSEFLRTLLQGYRGTYLARDFDDPASAETINNRVKAASGDHIERVIDGIPAETAAFLLNVVYFKADWEHPFAEDLTRPTPFTTGSGGSKEVPMMRTDARINVMRTEGYTAAELFFADSAFSLIAVRPDGFDPASVPDHEAVLKLAMRAAFVPERIDLQMPRVTLEFGENLIPAMKRLGMSRIFSEAEADLSPMGKALTGRNLHVDLLRHDAVLKIDERGAEGAAVTTAGFSATSLPPALVFDVPYHAVLRHVPTGIPVFIAYVNDPGEVSGGDAPRY